MSTKINLRSPYHYKRSFASAAKIKISIYVYEGTQTTDRPATAQYVITKDVTTPTTGDPYAVFEISELVRDYLDSSYNYYQSNCAWVDVIYQIINSSGGVVTGGSDPYVAMDGYGYFEEGINPQLSKRLLLSNKVMWRPEDENIRVPVFSEQATDVVFISKGQAVRSVSLSSTNNTSGVVSYVSVSGDVSVDNYRQRVLADGGVYEPSSCLYKLDNQVDVNLVDEVRVSRDGTYDKLIVKTMNCDKYPDRKVTFVNKFGAFQDVYFFAKEVSSINISGESYKSNIINYESLGYDTHKHQQQSYNLQAKESIVLNTGFVSEDYNEVLRQMMMSEQVWLTITTDEETNIFPVIPNTNSLSFKTSLNDKLVDYAVEFNYAFDKIQNIR
jgi:hypothetical protein